MSQPESVRQLRVEHSTPMILQERQLSTDGSQNKLLRIVTAIVVNDDKLAILDLEDRSLKDVEFTTAIDSVENLNTEKKTLINPNVIVVVDERDNNE